MKILFILSVTLLSIISHANTLDSIFKANTELPKILQEKIFTRMMKEIPGLTPFTVYEITTEVKEDRIDQGVRDFYYKTKLRVLTPFEHHRTQGYIIIESAEFSFYCPNDCHFEILDFRTIVL